MDDFALKKRIRYGTVMVDLNTHSIIDMIESREQEKVAEWLKSYPNIQVVSRDGSVTYHNSITEAHPMAVQVSDRFHLFKNLTDYAVEYLKKHLSKVIKIVTEPKDKVKSAVLGIDKGNENRKLTLEEKYHKVLLLQAEQRSQTKYAAMLIWMLGVTKNLCLLLIMTGRRCLKRWLALDMKIE
ncbi:MAG TPA: transposase [Clostridia bacterium]|nr:transposase [Clostridia bacterium]